MNTVNTVTVLDINTDKIVGALPGRFIEWGGFWQVEMSPEGAEALSEGGWDPVPVWGSACIRENTFSGVIGVVRKATR